MARTGISYEQFQKVMDDLVTAGTPSAKVSIAMLLEKLGGSKSTLIGFRRRYAEAHPDAPVAPQPLPADIVASIESYVRRRESSVRDQLHERIAGAAEAETMMLTEAEALEKEFDELRDERDALKSANATLSGQAAQQATEIAELRKQLAIARQEYALAERGQLHAEAQASEAHGLVQEIRATTAKQLDTARAELLAARSEAKTAQQYAVEVDKSAVDASARLEGERSLRASLEEQNEELRFEVKRLDAEANRAAAAEAAVQELRERVKQMTDTIAMLHGLVSKESKLSASSEGS